MKSESEDEFADVFREAFHGVGQDDAPDGTLMAAPTPDPEIEAQTQEHLQRIANELTAAGPPSWQHLHAVFALTRQAEIARMAYTEDTRSTDIAPTSSILQLVRELRELAARTPTGPWWRLVLDLTATDSLLKVAYDYGHGPFPDEHLFPPDAYRADLTEFGFPSEKLPTWLAAYVSHGGRQLRSPQAAAAQARADAAAGVRPVASLGTMPDVPTMWTRWATLAAAFVATSTAGLGPRVLYPSCVRYEDSTWGGSTLWLLPGYRAVLSGGVWDAPELAAAYRGDAPFPDLFAGAPDWVADPVLDTRGVNGLMSFCYWWEGGRWCRGESPEPADLATAIPDVWHADTVTDIVAHLTGRGGEPAIRSAAARLVAAAEGGLVQRDLLIQVFGDDDRDIDGAFHQLLMAGVVKLTDLPPIPEHVAIGIVRDYMLDNGLDKPGYRAADLTASRLSVGWTVYVPVPRGEYRIWRTIFYLADDGVLEQSTSAVHPLDYEIEFEQRYRERRNA